MSNPEDQNPETTAVDDVRAVREKIDRQHGGNMKEHIEETNRIGELWRAKLNLRLVPPPRQDPVPTGSK